MKPKAIIVCNAPANIDYVYTKEVLAELAELTDLYPEIVTDLSQGDFKDVEYMFSTWGMLAPSEEELAAYVPNLKALFYGAGATDRFVRPFFARNIRVFSAWHANAIPVAEFSLAQILLALKGYFLNTRDVHSKGWKGAFRGPGIYGDTVALIGDGAISTKIQALLKNFNVNVIAIPSRPELRTISLEEAFKTAFVVSNHLPNRDDNIGVINRTHFESMRHGATFINTGRGAQVNEADMIDVLKARPDLTALLDVTFPEPPAEGSELYTLPNVKLSSHIAGSLNDEVHRMSEYMIDEFKRFISGGELRYEVTEDILITSKS
ncbi:MAG: hydroxyacid dehydrogenase [Lentisphaerae bacterium]|nr:hydroxyacid dehydrogenase [Lentisphaerota bacterium]